MPSILWLTSDAQAILSLQMNGVILNQSLTNGTFVVGQSWTLDIDYNQYATDGSGPGTYFDTIVGTYNAIERMSFASGSYVATATSGRITIWNDGGDRGSSLYDSFMISINPLAEGSNFPDVGIYGALTFELKLTDTTQVAFNSDHLPTALSINDFNLEESRIQWWGDAIPYVDLQTQSISIVPEPSSSAIVVGLGAMVFLSVRRRRI